MLTDSNVFEARYKFRREAWVVENYRSKYGHFYCDLKTVRDTTTPTNNCNCGKHNLAGDRIVNGQATNPHEYPFFVALTEYYTGGGRNVFCGASIISKRWV